MSTSDKKMELDGNSSTKKKEKVVYFYGNYPNYYGIRYKYNTDDAIGVHSDPRIGALVKNLPVGGDLLDIGCNSGLFTAALAKRLRCREVLGVDIDESLIKKALKYEHVLHEKEVESVIVTEKEDRDGYTLYPYFPPSVVEECGPISAENQASFLVHIQDCVRNVTQLRFETADFVDDQFQTDRRFDIICCLSLTKWIHLNGGDEALKKLFHKVFEHLNDGGIFVVEPQDFDSYKKNYTPKHHKLYKDFQFLPEHFKDFLLTEVGFVDYKILPYNYELKNNAKKAKNVDDNDEMEVEAESKKNNFDKRAMQLYYKAQADPDDEENESEI